MTLRIPYRARRTTVVVDGLIDLDVDPIPPRHIMVEGIRRAIASTNPDRTVYVFKLGPVNDKSVTLLAPPPTE